MFIHKYMNYSVNKDISANQYQKKSDKCLLVGEPIRVLLALFIPIGSRS